MTKLIINKKKTKLFVKDIETYCRLVKLHVIIDTGFYFGSWFAIDDLDNLTIDEFTLDFYNGWDDQILTKLKEIKEIADWYSNPLANDAGGSKLCDEILDVVKPLIKKISDSMI